MTEIFRPPYFQPDNVNGVPLAGALLYFYTAGTTTPITVYQDSGLITPHAFPVVADASGIFPIIYVNSTTYKTVLKTALGVTVQTADNINTTAASSTVLDSVFTLQNASDQTKQAQFSLAGLTTGTLRTYTLPDSNGTLLTTGSAATLAQALAGTSSTAVIAANALAQERQLISSPFNLGLAASVGSSALTVSVKGADGNDPSSSNPVTVSFRNVTAATGTPTSLTLTAALSLVISSGSTMGFTSATIGRLWIVLFNDAGTARLGLVNALSGTSIMALRPGLYSSTAEGGAGGADSAQIIYTNSAVTAKAMIILGYLEATEATAGTWATTPSLLKVYMPGDPLPGDNVGTPARNSTGAVSTGTTVVPLDDTIPQSNEGDQYLSQAIVPSSGANLLSVDATLNLATSVGNNTTAAIFRDATANALSAVNQNMANDAVNVVRVTAAVQAGATTSTTFKVRAGGSNAGTTTFNGVATARKLGGVFGSYISISEIVA